MTLSENRGSKDNKFKLIFPFNVTHVTLWWDMQLHFGIHFNAFYHSGVTFFYSDKQRMQHKQLKSHRCLCNSFQSLKASPDRQTDRDCDNHHHHIEKRNVRSECESQEAGSVCRTWDWSESHWCYWGRATRTTMTSDDTVFTQQSVWTQTGPANKKKDDYTCILITGMKKYTCTCIIFTFCHTI